MEDNQIQDLKDGISGILCAPVYERVNDEDLDSLRDMLDTFNPYRLLDCMKCGANDFLNEFNEYISNDTKYVVKNVINALEEGQEQLVQVWDVLDEYDRNKVLNTIAEGALSNETIFGTALGTLSFPGIGTYIGAFLGGKAAGNRMQKELEKILELFSTGVSKYLDYFTESIENYIIPSLFQDISNQIEEDEKETKLIESGEVIDSKDDIVTQLEKIKQMVDEGFLSKKEAAKLKKELLNQ